MRSILRVVPELRTLLVAEFPASSWELAPALLRAVAVPDEDTAPPAIARRSGPWGTWERPREPGRFLGGVFVPWAPRASRKGKR